MVLIGSLAGAQDNHLEHSALSRFDETRNSEFKIWLMDTSWAELDAIARMGVKAAMSSLFKPAHETCGFKGRT